MPMYEYECKTCDATFDMLRRMDQSDDGIACPTCGKRHVQRKLSTFAAFTKSSSGTMVATAGTGGGCGCSSGGCSSCNSNN